MHWMLMPLRRYADFAGRSQRKEYWMFALLNLLISAFVLLMLAVSYYADMSETAMMTLLTPVFLLYGIVSLAFIVPGLAVTVRRLHDTDRSGWNILWGLVPVIGAFILLYFYVSDGTPGTNRFGPNPKASAATA